MFDEFAQPIRNPEQERLRHVVLAAREKARWYLRESGFLLAPDMPNNIARIVCDSVECEFDGQSLRFVADGKEFADLLDQVVVRITPWDFPVIRGVFRFNPLQMQGAEDLTGEDALPKAGLVIEAMSDRYNIRIKSGHGDGQLMLIHRGDDLTTYVGSNALSGLMERINVTIYPRKRSAIFNFSLRTRN